MILLDLIDFQEVGGQVGLNLARLWEVINFQ